MSDNIKQILKVVGLLVLGAVLGYGLLIGTALLRITRSVRNPGFLASISMASTHPQMMSNEEDGSIGHSPVLLRTECTFVKQ